MMKKITLLLAAVALTGTIYAQGVSGGLKLGLNLASQKFEADGFSISPDGRTSFHAGLFLTAMLSENFGVQPELLYSSVGSVADFGAGETTNKFSYISIPIMLRYNPIPMLNLHAGPQFGILASAVAEADGEEEDIENMKSMDFGIGIGAGLDLPMGLTASLRYVAGMSNISDMDDVDATIKNNVFQISLGYKFFGAGD